MARRRNGAPDATPFPLSLPFVTFGELEGLGLEAVVGCHKCSRSRLLESNVPALRDRPIAGQRFRCTLVRPDGIACAGMGSVSISRQGSWAAQQARMPRRVRLDREA